MPERRPNFFSELRRRHVFRVAGVYAAAAWGVLQVTGTLEQLLELPGWTGKVVVALVALGFPAALALAWAYDLTAEGVERTPAEPGAPAVRTGIRRAWLLGGAAIVLLAAGAAILLRYRTVRASPTVVAVLPFSARGSAAYLGDGMVDLLSRNLDGVEHLRAVDPATIVTLSRKRPAGPIDIAAARDVASRLGAGLFVIGNVNETAGVLRISAALYDSEQEQPPQAQATVQGDTTRLFQLVDSLTAQLVAGRNHGRASQRLVRTAAATTASLAALKAFLDGEHHLRAAQYDSAVDAFRVAVGADSTFGLAHYRLAIAARLNGQLDVASEALDHAGRNSLRLPQRDRRVLDAYVAYQAGEADSAEARYRAILRDYPDDVEATFELAKVLEDYNPARARPVTEAAQLYRQVLAADPQFLCPI